MPQGIEETWGSPSPHAPMLSHASPPPGHHAQPPLPPPVHAAAPMATLCASTPWEALQGGEGDTTPAPCPHAKPCTPMCQMTCPYPQPCPQPRQTLVQWFPGHLEPTVCYLAVVPLTRSHQACPPHPTTTHDHHGAPPQLPHMSPHSGRQRNTGKGL